MENLWRVVRGSDPIVATAIHDGHELREEVASRLALSESDRLREEDPFSGSWTTIAPTQIVPRRSRFEVDLNRPRERAVYRKPEDAWGLEVWKDELPEVVIERSLAEYDAFYNEALEILSGLVDRFRAVVVLDLHTYNHRRRGADRPAAAQAGSPEVNVGTGTVDRERFGGVVERFIADLRKHPFMGRHLDVRENVRFVGGHFSRWIHQTFPGSVCTLAVELKKFFMDEWSGELLAEPHEEIGRALASTIAGLRAELRSLAMR